MKLLMKREQTTGRIGQVNFKLWTKIEVDDDEKALLDRYKFDRVLLMGEYDPALLRKAGIGGLIIAFFAAFIFDFIFPINVAALLGLVTGGGAAYWYYNEKRDRVFVRDLLHGRQFKCHGIIEADFQEVIYQDVTPYRVVIDVVNAQCI